MAWKIQGREIATREEVEVMHLDIMRMSIPAILVQIADTVPELTLRSPTRELRNLEGIPSDDAMARLVNEKFGDATRDYMIESRWMSGARDGGEHEGLQVRLIDPERQRFDQELNCLIPLDYKGPKKGFLSPSVRGFYGGFSAAVVFFGFVKLSSFLLDYFSIFE
ncbi:MAG: hypothetical protein HOE06_06130 [Candidatus Thioglobus sp.]|jgi:hypothetical protein|nr:hypothetical protein [Candidatus Thioglobus sp.]MBT7912750.1 hypothetical protein [Candidatus Bathyarchaeota archaeon]